MSSGFHLVPYCCSTRTLVSTELWKYGTMGILYPPELLNIPSIHGPTVETLLLQKPGPEDDRSMEKVSLIFFLQTGITNCTAGSDYCSPTAAPPRNGLDGIWPCGVFPLSPREKFGPWTGSSIRRNNDGYPRGAPTRLSFLFFSLAPAMPQLTSWTG